MRTPTAPGGRRPRRERRAAQERRGILAFLVVTVVLLPLVGGLVYAAHEAFRYRAAAGRHRDHEAKRALGNAALLIAGAPGPGAGLGWPTGSLRRRRPGVSAATGALPGTLALWVTGLVSVHLAIRHGTFG